MCLEACLDSHSSAKANGVSKKGLDQFLESQTNANGIFLDFILSREHILKVHLVNIATPYILEHPDFVES